MIPWESPQPLSVVRVKEAGDEKYFSPLEKRVGAEQLRNFLSSFPEFSTNYESWYSEALVLIRQVLPDRVHNFISHYEIPRGRKTIKFGTYVIQDYLLGIEVSNGPRTIVDRLAAIPHFDQQLAILKAAEKRFESSLFEMQQLVQADIFESEIDVAQELLKHKFVRAAGAIAGVVLEKHLHQVCKDHNVRVPKRNPTISDFNELLKASSVIDIPQWRHVSMLGDIRNLCSHNKDKEPTADQVLDLIDGTRKVLKTLA